MGLLAVLLFGLKGRDFLQPLFPSLLRAGTSLCAVVVNLGWDAAGKPLLRSPCSREIPPLMDSLLLCLCFPCCISLCTVSQYWLNGNHC